MHIHCFVICIKIELSVEELSSLIQGLGKWDYDIVQNVIVEDLCETTFWMLLPDTEFSSRILSKYFEQNIYAL